MNILLAGSSTFGVKNLGDDAMLSCLVLTLRLQFPQAKISILLRHPEGDYGDLFGIRVLKNFDHDDSESAAGRFFLGLNEGDERRQLADIYNEVASADLLIIAGNSLMALGPPSLFRGVSSYATLMATLSAFANTPYIVWGLNVVDPLEDPALVAQARFLIGGAGSVNVREPAALEHLSDALGSAAVQKVAVGTDPAWGLDEKAVGNVDTTRLLECTGYRGLLDGQFISLNLRSEYWSSSPKDEYQLGQGLEALRWATERGLDVLLVPNCVYGKGAKLQDDRAFHRMLLERAGSPRNVYSIENELTVFETVKLLSFSHAHVTNRRHSAFFSVMGRVPTVVLSTSLATHNTGWFTQDARGDHSGVLLGETSTAEALSTLAARTQPLSFPNIDALRQQARGEIVIEAARENTLGTAG